MIYNPYNNLTQMWRELSAIFNPPERLRVSQAAEKYRYLKNQGSYVGPWKNTVTPYMTEPMDELNNPALQAVIFVGPAQSGKTDALIINWTAYSVVSDPMDMIIYTPTMAATRDFSTRRINRLHRHSEAVGAMLSAERDADNKFDKHYRNGMMLTLSWPSSTELAGRPIPRVALTDYDRIPDDIDGEGSAFDLAIKRTTTFGTQAMALAESSPSREITDPRWISKTPHEAPPTTGILALYNRGDRRRFYWPCPHCEGYFEGEFSMLKWDTLSDNLSSAETVRMVCPLCDAEIYPDDRKEMSLWGTWLKDGQVIHKGKKEGRPVRSSIGSFWLKGVAATFVSWKKLVETYLTAKDEMDKTGSEEALKKFYNTDLAEIYISKNLESERLPELLKSRAEMLGEKVVPEGVRFLLACVDVQKNMFVVQVHGICPGEPSDIVIIDRYNVYKSKRTDDDGEHYWVKPASYEEDWDELIEHVIEKDYPLADESGRRMAIKLTLCDSGGRDGATTNAYNFYRRLKKQNKHGRFHLVKGEGKPDQVRVRITYPDSDRKDRNAGARGDIPVLIINTILVKDALNGRLDVVQAGKGLIRFPDWLPDWFYGELCSEYRDAKGWHNPSGSRNEAWDLLDYCLAGLFSKLIQSHLIDWSTENTWYSDWDTNNMIRQKNNPKLFAKAEEVDYDFGKFAKELA